MSSLLLAACGLVLGAVFQAYPRRQVTCCRRSGVLTGLSTDPELLAKQSASRFKAYEYDSLCLTPDLQISADTFILRRLRDPVSLPLQVRAQVCGRELAPLLAWCISYMAPQHLLGQALVRSIPATNLTPDRRCALPSACCDRSPTKAWLFLSPIRAQAWSSLKCTARQRLRLRLHCQT